MMAPRHGPRPVRRLVTAVVACVALALGLLAACLLAAEALHYAVERPAQRWIRSRWSR